LLRERADVLDVFKAICRLRLMEALSLGDKRAVDAID
jgi:hypothetical protein